MTMPMAMAYSIGNRLKPIAGVIWNFLTPRASATSAMTTHSACTFQSLKKSCILLTPSRKILPPSHAHFMFTHVSMYSCLVI